MLRVHKRGAGPGTSRPEQAGAGPSRRTPPVHALAQPGPSTQNMSFEEAYRYEVGLEHFVQGHMMREGLGISLFTPGMIGRSSFHARDSLSTR